MAGRWRRVRGREPGYPGPPAQIRTSPIKASGSYQAGTNPHFSQTPGKIELVP